MRYLSESRCIGGVATFILVVFSLLLMNGLLLSQDSKSGVIPTKQMLSRAMEYHEYQDDEYILVDKASMPRSPAYRYASAGFTMVQVNTDSLGQNIVGDAGNEPSIAMDPTNPDHMVIGWRQFDTITNNFRQAGNAYTTDGGLTWTNREVIEPGMFRSDPVLDFDTDGNIYYNSLTVQGDFWCDVFISDDGGMTWDEGTFAQGGDKQWMAIDKTEGIGNGHIYAFWSNGLGICNPGFFTRSIDVGGSYEDCTEISGSPYWGTLTVGPEGNLFVGGWNGNTFLVAKSNTAQDEYSPVFWEFSTLVDLDGDIDAFAGYSSPNPTGLLGQTWIAIDHSDGESRGNIYLLCSVERDSNSDPLDVMFAKSTDGGLTFSDPIRLNDDPTNNAWQWLSTMGVAPNGRIDVVWLDTRNNNGVESALYYTYSLDAGETWAENEQLTEEFDPHVGWPNQDKMGDYFDIISVEEGCHVAWAGTFNGEQDVYYSFISPSTTSIDVAQEPIPAEFHLAQNYPNPFNPSTVISLQLPESSDIVLTVFDVNGQKVRELARGTRSAGVHEFTWDGTNQAGESVSSGVYVYTVTTASGFTQSNRMTLVR